MSRLRPLLAAAAVVATLGGLGLGATSAGAEGALGLEGIVEAPTLSPGSSSTHTLTVSNDRTGPVRLVLRTEDVTQSENGCARPEQTVAGEECDGDGGELARDLSVALARDGQEIWRGGFDDLADGALVAESMPGGAEWDLDVTVDLALASPNDTMTDTLGFTTVLEATDGTGPPEVAGVQATLTGEIAPQTAGGAGGVGVGGTSVPTAVDAGIRWEVPLTGTSVSVWPLLVNAGVLLAAAVLWWQVRRGRRRPQKVCSGPGNVPPRTSSA